MFPSRKDVKDNQIGLEQNLKEEDKKLLSDFEKEMNKVFQIAI